MRTLHDPSLCLSIFLKILKTGPSLDSIIVIYDSRYSSPSYLGFSFQPCPWLRLSRFSFLQLSKQRGMSESISEIILLLFIFSHLLKQHNDVHLKFFYQHFHFHFHKNFFAPLTNISFSFPLKKLLINMQRST